MSSNDQQTELDAYDIKNESSERSPATEDPPDDEDKASLEKSEFQTGDSLANEYLETVAGADIQESSAKRYEKALRSYIRYLENRGVSLLDAEAKSVKDYLRETCRNDLSKSTLKTRLTAIWNLYKYIRIESTSTADIDMIALDDMSSDDFTAREGVEKEPLSKTELKKLCDAMGTHRNRLMVLLGSETGARNGSMRSLKLRDVKLDDEQPEVKIPNIKSGGTYRIPISGQMALELERWIKVLRDPDTETPYLFPSDEGGKLETSQSFLNFTKKAAEKASIQEVISEREPTKAERQAGMEKDVWEQHRVTPHLLRHTFSLLLEEAGLNTEARRDALDHENAETTKEHYTHSESDYEDLIRELLHEESSGSDSDPDSD